MTDRLRDDIAAMHEQIIGILESHQIEWVDDEAGYLCGCDERGELPHMRWLADALGHQVDAVLDAVRPHIEALTAERDLAIAHDRHPYPTAFAYEQACKALHAQRERAELAEARLDGQAWEDLTAERDALRGQLADSEDALERAKTDARIASAQRDRWWNAGHDAIVQRDRWRDAARKADQRIQAVRELHKPDTLGPIRWGKRQCRTCSRGLGVGDEAVEHYELWPCPTVRALDPPDRAEKTPEAAGGAP